MIEKWQARPAALACTHNWILSVKTGVQRRFASDSSSTHNLRTQNAKGPKSIVLPVVFYECETWCLILRIVLILMTSENIILRIMFRLGRRMGRTA
jgi:hypothetical protein